MKKHQVVISRGALILIVFVIILLGVILWSARRRQDVDLHVRTGGSIESMLPSIVNITQGSIERGNAVEVLQNGDQFFPRLMADIEAAKGTVHLESYVWWEGEICDQLAALLARKAREKVEVRVLVDASGGNKMTDEIEELFNKSGVELAKFHPPRLSNIGRLNNRDHRKIIVIDGHIGYVGGFGISQEWTGHAQDKDHWRDTGLRIRGPLVAHLQGAFTENWIEETGQVTAGPRYFPPLTAAGPTPAHVAYTSPGGSATSVQLLHYLAMASAHERIIIQNPYLLPDDETVEVLAAAVKRGVDVRIMVPSASATDSAFVQHASHHTYERLLRAGVKLFEYQHTLLHQKVMIVDGLWSGVGSTNFDARSFQLNDEITVGVVDRDVAASLERTFNDDMKHARQVTVESWKKRTFRHRTTDALAYLFNEQL